MCRRGRPRHPAYASDPATPTQTASSHTFDHSIGFASAAGARRREGPEPETGSDPHHRSRSARGPPGRHELPAKPGQRQYVPYTIEVPATPPPRRSRPRARSARIRPSCQSGRRGRSPYASQGARHVPRRHQRVAQMHPACARRACSPARPGSAATRWELRHQPGPRCRYASHEVVERGGHGVRGANSSSRGERVATRRRDGWAGAGAGPSPRSASYRPEATVTGRAATSLLALCVVRRHRLAVRARRYRARHALSDRRALRRRASGAAKLAPRARIGPLGSGLLPKSLCVGTASADRCPEGCTSRRRRATVNHQKVTDMPERPRRRWLRQQQGLGKRTYRR